jgi:hypothetical protein
VTHVYTTGDVTVVTQTCRNLFLKGFGIANLKDEAATGVHGFLIDIVASTSNDQSRYEDMYFYKYNPTYITFSPLYTVGNSPCMTRGNFAGTWTRCIGSMLSFRPGTAEGDFTATMIDCIASAYSFHGDLGGDFVGARLERCRCVGTETFVTAGFGGCSTIAAGADAATVFIECESGDNSFCLSNDCAATFLRCRGGANCFACNIESGENGGFSGYAEDCIAGPGSFGGSGNSAALSSLSGTLVRCTVTGSVEPWRLTGATIRDSLLTVTTTNKNGVTLLDSNSKIYNSTILVNAAGNGVPVHAASARNVRVAHCRFNNADTDADGLHANVTNLIGTPYNVIDDDIT